MVLYGFEQNIARDDSPPVASESWILKVTYLLVLLPLLHHFYLQPQAPTG
jgi:hypothetical protein